MASDVGDIVHIPVVTRDAIRHRYQYIQFSYIHQGPCPRALTSDLNPQISEIILKLPVREPI
jgi:hypothetical protein